LDEAEVVRLLEQAWNEFYDMEYEGALGAWRGIHLQAKTDQVPQGFIRMDYPRDEFIALEQAEMECIRNQPPEKR
jgi:hypothetical protein